MILREADPKGQLLFFCARKRCLVHKVGCGVEVLQFDAFADKSFFFDGLKYLRKGNKEVLSAFD